MAADPLGYALRPADLVRPLPAGWTLLVGGDTGTYMSAAFVGFPPDSYDAFVLEEFPNYRYVAGEIELLDESIPEWAKRVKSAYLKYRPGVTKFPVWLDENSQFKTELRRYGLNAKGNRNKLEVRVEISREYMRNSRVHLAPWLSILPYELEHATWPDETTSAGRFERLKVDDHTLDCLEHILSRRPRHKSQTSKKPQTLKARLLQQYQRVDVSVGGDPHLGRQ